jgi:hypothetical protein
MRRREKVSKTNMGDGGNTCKLETRRQEKVSKTNMGDAAHIVRITS